MSGCLQEFITNATPSELTNLVKFWTGWKILPKTLSLEVVKGRYPTASTCYETLRIPGHYKDYMSFKSDILGCISTCQTGFGLVWVWHPGLFLHLPDKICYSYIVSWLEKQSALLDSLPCSTNSPKYLVQICFRHTFNVCVVKIFLVNNVCNH